MHRIVDSRCVLAVRNLQESTPFYIDVLGFRRDFGDGSAGWSFLSRDNFKVRLGECHDEKPASALGDHAYVVYLTVEGLDQLKLQCFVFANILPWLFAIPSIVLSPFLCRADQLG